MSSKTTPGPTQLNVRPTPAPPLTSFGVLQTKTQLCNLIEIKMYCLAQTKIAHRFTSTPAFAHAKRRCFPYLDSMRAMQCQIKESALHALLDEGDEAAVFVRNKVVFVA